jgi:Spy/CpxP family protein refolding chaperone
MKKVVNISIVSAIILTIAGLTVNAQPGYGKNHGKGHGHGYGYPDSCRIQLMVDDMKQALDLSDKQVKEIEQIHYDHMEEAKEMKSKYKNDCVAARDARIAMRDKVHQEIEAVLNDDQKVKFGEFIAQRKGPHGHHKGHRK